MYLYYFERIIRKYSGSTTFALPYWNWDDPSGSQLVLNSIFLTGGPLFITQRSDAANPDFSPGEWNRAAFCVMG